MLGLDFITVVPRSTSPEKIELIEFYGGRCHYVDSGPEMYREAERLAAECGGIPDQFTYAERATDWRGNNNIAESVFASCERERHPIPDSDRRRRRHRRHQRDVGRYVRYRQHPTRVAVVDPKGSAFFGGWSTGAADTPPAPRAASRASAGRA